MTDHRREMLQIYRKAMARREYLVFDKLNLYENMPPMDATDRDIAIEIESLRPLAMYCLKHGVSFEDVGIFVSASQNKAIDSMCLESLQGV